MIVSEAKTASWRLNTDGSEGSSKRAITKPASDVPSPTTAASLSRVPKQIYQRLSSTFGHETAGSVRDPYAGRYSCNRSPKQIE